MKRVPLGKIDGTYVWLRIPERSPLYQGHGNDLDDYVDVLDEVAAMMGFEEDG